MRKYIIILVAILSCGVLLLGCGSSEKEDSGVNQIIENLGPTATETPTPRPKSGVVDEKVAGAQFSISADISLQVEEYNEKSETFTVVEGILQCGKQYVLRFIGDGVKERDKLKSNELKMKITLQMGNEKEIRLITDFYEEAGALNFKQVGQTTGKYEAEFVLSKEKNLDLSKGYFTFCIDEIMAEANNKFPISVKLDYIPEEGKEELVSEIQIHGVETQRTDFKLQKGDYIFDDNNITYGIGAEVEKTTMYVEVPEQSKGIEILFFSDKGRKTRYGEGTTGVLYPETGQNKLTVIIAKYMKEYVGKDRYEELRKENKTIYLRIKSLGGNSYNDVTIDVEYTLN